MKKAVFEFRAQTGGSSESILRGAGIGGGSSSQGGLCAIPQQATTVSERLPSVPLASLNAVVFGQKLIPIRAYLHISESPSLFAASRSLACRLFGKDYP